MKYKEFVYERPNMEEIKVKFNMLLDSFIKAESFEIQDCIIKEINIIRIEIESMIELVFALSTSDTTNKEYEEAMNYLNEDMPKYEELVSEYYKVLIQSRFRTQLEEKWGKQLFTIAELTVKIFSPEIINDLELENKLATEYMKLIASASIMFEGEERNLPELILFQQSADREIRKRAFEARTSFLEKNEEKIDSIFDQLIKVRTQIARKLGYKNFIELGYVRLLRSDYNSDMVNNFRKQVVEYIVPVCTKLREQQRERLGLEKLRYYDEGFQFKTGNAVPKGTPEWIIEKGLKMYSELSEETKEFFKYMVENELMDLLSRKGKANIAYCTSFKKYKAPFIMANFNGTSGDIEILTHEAGHAFQDYLSRNFEVPEYYNPTKEACEIHSMSMELFTWPWMELFFEEGTEKYKFSHLSESLLFIPYGAAVDEFQHFVYGNPEATPTERKKEWREIEKKYLPHRDYADNDFLERGGWWLQQSHIFRTPFYYIDYALAQICAYQFWKKMNEDREEAWRDYLELCHQGGGKSFVSLIKKAKLISPFEDGCIQAVIGTIESWLNARKDIVL